MTVPNHNHHLCLSLSRPIPFLSSLTLSLSLCLSLCFLLLPSSVRSHPPPQPRHHAALKLRYADAACTPCFRALFVASDPGPRPHFQLVHPEAASADAVLLLACSTPSTSPDSCTSALRACCPAGAEVTHLLLDEGRLSQQVDYDSDSDDDTSYHHHHHQRQTGTGAGDIEQQMNADPFYKAYRTLPALWSRWKAISNLSSSSNRQPVATLLSIGQSIENRSIPALIIGTPPSSNTTRPARKAVVLNALQHAREWLTTSVATYIAERLVRACMSDDPAVVSLLSAVDIVVLPMVNPDGYAFSGASFDSRFWRKNRRRGPSGTVDTNGLRCDGVDLNRNWGADFGGVYSTSQRCADDYRGEAAFSEPEVSAVRDFFLVRSDNGDDVALHVDVHAFGELLLGPFGYEERLPANESGVRIIAERVNEMLRREYAYSAGAGNDLYAVSGIMADWSFSRGVWSVTAELPPRMDEVLEQGGGGLQGFDADPGVIARTAAQWFDVVVALGGMVRDGERPFGQGGGDGGGGAGGAVGVGGMVGVGVAAVAAVGLVAAVWAVVVGRGKGKGKEGDVEKGESEGGDGAGAERRTSGAGSEAGLGPGLDAKREAAEAE